MRAGLVFQSIERSAQKAQIWSASAPGRTQPTSAPIGGYLRAGGIRALATLCDERRDGDPRVGASAVRMGVWPLETRARYLGNWRL